MVELRKRKAPAEPAPAPPPKKSNSVKGAVNKAKNAISGKSSASTAAGKVEVGATIELDGFGGEIETNDGAKTTLKKLVDDSREGVVLFTYPKASTPGCTKQACMFRDDYTPLTATGLAIYGLSRDSPKANTTFKTKQNLPYPLLCDPGASLIGAIGMKKAPSGTNRGVFVVSKQGKVLATEAGGPAATVEVVRKLVGSQGGAGAEGGAATAPAKEASSAEETAAAPPAASADASEVAANGTADAEDKEKAAVAADVADTAAKLDGTPKPA